RWTAKVPPSCSHFRLPNDGREEGDGRVHSSPLGSTAPTSFPDPSLAEPTLDKPAPHSFRKELRMQSSGPSLTARAPAPSRRMVATAAASVVFALLLVWSATGTAAPASGPVVSTGTASLLP